MSEPTIPFQGQTAVMDRPVADPAGDVPPGADGGRRTKLLLLGGAAAVAVLGLLAYFLVFAGGEPVADEGQPVTPAPAAPAPEAEPVEPAEPLRLTAKNYGRDPFEPRIVEVVEPVAPAAPAPVAPVTAPVGTPALPGSTDGSSGTSTQPETSVPQSSPSHSFKVVEVAENNKTVTVKVDGKLYKDLEAGEVFAEYFKVVLISGQVNSFQYGEEKFNVLGTKKLTIA